jgi:hypothetical protein
MRLLRCPYMLICSSAVFCNSIELAAEFCSDLPIAGIRSTADFVLWTLGVATIGALPLLLALLTVFVE